MKNYMRGIQYTNVQYTIVSPIYNIKKIIVLHTATLILFGWLKWVKSEGMNDKLLWLNLILESIPNTKNA